jgi:type IX secretion system PorP/SprF family membrane protein
MKRKLILASAFLFLSVILKAQDHLYSQFYNSPNYLNPALNGQFDGDLRMNLIYRNQWANISGSLTYYTMSIDYHVPKFNGGFGLMMTRASEGVAGLNKTNISGIYSYSVTTENSILSFGIQAGFTNRNINYEKLVFSDQLNESGIIPGGVSEATPPEFNNRFYFDSGAGINLVTGNFMIGAAVQHINKPDESFTGGESPLPMRINGHLSYDFALDRYDLEAGPSFIPSVIYYKQANSHSFSAGMQYKNKAVNVGLWYRGQGKNQDALVVSLILDLFVRKDYYDKVRLGVSHDATTSSLSYGRTDGTTEGALTYETTFPNRNYNSSRSNSGNGKRCYDFY